MKKRAIVTIVYGKKYKLLFDTYSRESWERYAERVDADLFVIEELIDSSKRAMSRSVSWQKCLVSNYKGVSDYSRVLWLDSDIVINETAPDIFSCTAEDKVGVVDAFGFIDRSHYDLILKEFNKKLGRKRVNELGLSTPIDYHEVFGLKNDLLKVVQCGVILFSPKLHSSVFEYVYFNYEDKGDPHWHYEMRPLSFELQNNCRIDWLDYRFNSVWPDYREVFYPFLNNWLYKLARKLGVRIYPYKNCLETYTRNSYFSHFAGSQKELKVFFKKSNRRSGD